ncbi:hypothetical protein V7P28_22530, partial [Klebsiella michiganensis]
DETMKFNCPLVSINENFSAIGISQPLHGKSISRRFIVNTDFSWSAHNVWPIAEKFSFMLTSGQLNFIVSSTDFANKQVNVKKY